MPNADPASTTKEFSPINWKAGIPYLGKVFVFLALDAEWSRKACYSAHTSRSTAITQVFKNIEKGCEQIILDKQLNIDECSKENLYKPIKFLPIGHADASVAILMDDLVEPIHSLSQKLSTTIEEMQIAFCPDIEKFTKSVNYSREIDTKKAELSSKLFQNVTNFFSSSDDSENLPIVFTRIKYTALAQIGYANRIEGSLYKCLTDSLLDTVFTFTETLSQPTNESKKTIIKELESLGIVMADLTRLQISFIDLQGQEELGIIFRNVSNLSLPMILLNRAEAIPVSELYKLKNGGKDWFEQHEQSQWWHELEFGYQKAQEEAQENNDLSHQASSLSDGLKLSSIIRWSRSSYYLPYSSTQLQFDKVTGYCIGFSGIEIKSGSYLPTEQINIHLAEQSSPYRIACQNTRMLGEWDSLITYKLASGQQQDEFQNTKEFIEALSSVWDIIGNIHTNGRIIIGWESRIAAKISAQSYFSPKIRASEKNTEKYDPFELILNRRTLPEIFSIDHLKESLCDIGCTDALQNSIINLYQKLNITFLNPNTFDIILDLWDTSRTFYSILTDHLPKEIKNNTIISADAEKPIKSQITRAHARIIAAYTSRLDKTLLHRMHRSSPDQYNSNMETDFRGGLNQIISAADATLKLGVGLLRSFAQQNHPKTDIPRRSTVGIIPFIGIEPGIILRTHHFRLGYLPKLASIEMDVPHSVHVPSFVDILHESFHLIYDELRNASLTRDDIVPCVARWSEMDEELSEIFVTMLQILYVTPYEPELLTTYIVSQYTHNYSTTGFDDDSREACRRNLCNGVICLYLSTAILKHSGVHEWLETNKPNEAPFPRYEELEFINLKEQKSTILKDFKAFFDHHLKYAFIGSDKDKEDCYKYSCIAINEKLSTYGFSYLDRLAYECLKLVASFRDSVVQKSYIHNESYTKNIKQWQNKIKSSLEKNLTKDKTYQPIDVSEYTEYILEQTHYTDRLQITKKQDSPPHLDNMVLLCGCIRHSLKSRYDMINNEVINHSKTIIDIIQSSSPNIKITSLPSREHQLQEQIVLLKSLWSMSGKLKAKRLGRLIKLTACNRTISNKYAKLEKSNILPSEKLKLLISRGIEYTHFNYHREGLTDLNEAYELALSNNITEQLADIYYYQGINHLAQTTPIDNLEATDCFTKAIKLGQEKNNVYVKSYLKRGEAHRLNNSFVDEISDYTTVIELILAQDTESQDIKIYEVYKLRALAFCTLEDFSSAVSDYTNAIDNTDSRSVLQAELTLARAFTYLKIDDITKSLTDFKSVFRSVTISHSTQNEKSQYEELKNEALYSWITTLIEKCLPKEKGISKFCKELKSLEDDLAILEYAIRMILQYFKSTTSESDEVDTETLNQNIIIITVFISLLEQSQSQLLCGLYYYRASIYGDLGGYQTGKYLELEIADYTSIIHLEGAPKISVCESYYNRGICYSLYKNKESYLKELNDYKALESMNNDNKPFVPHELMFSTYYNLACVYSNLNEPSNSIESLEQLIKLNVSHSGLAEQINEDSDFNNIRTDKGFINFLVSITS